MALPTHQLGRTGLQITRVGFGSWAVGGGGWAYGWGPQDAESLATMRRALELGVNWKRHDTSVSSIAIAWTLAWPGVTGAIVGARAPKQVDGWIGAASIALTRRDLDDVAAAIRQTGAGVGPAQQATASPAIQEVAQ